MYRYMNTFTQHHIGPLSSSDCLHVCSDDGMPMRLYIKCDDSESVKPFFIETTALTSMDNLIERMGVSDETRILIMECIEDDGIRPKKKILGISEGIIDGIFTVIVEHANLGPRNPDYYAQCE